MLSAHPQISAGDELPFVNEITSSMPRILNRPLTYPEALAELWMGDRREGLDELRDHYLQRVLQLGILEPGALGEVLGNWHLYPTKSLTVKV